MPIDIQALVLLEGVPEDGIFFSPFPLHLQIYIYSTSQDWKRHKPLCKSDATRSSVDSLNAKSDTEEPTVERATLSHDVGSDRFEGRTSGHSVEVPMKDGSTMRLTTNTLGPKTLRGIRKFAEDN